MPNPAYHMSQYPKFIRRDVRKRELNVPDFVELARVWSLIGDPATARRFLTPAMQTALASSPKFETWCMGTGWVCCSCEGTLDGENVDRFLVHARRLLAAVGK